MSQPFIRETFQMYIHKGEYYLYGWNNWSLFGSLTCFYTDFLEGVIRKSKTLSQSNKLFYAELTFDRNPDEPEVVYEIQMVLKLIEKSQAIEIKNSICEVQNLSEGDKDLIADNLKILLRKF